jgi:hypothetical protein
VSAFETPYTWAQAEKRVSLDSHPEHLGHDKMAEFVNIDRDPEYENNRKDD